MKAPQALGKAPLTLLPLVCMILRLICAIVVPMDAPLILAVMNSPVSAINTSCDLPLVDERPALDAEEYE